MVVLLYCFIVVELTDNSQIKKSEKISPICLIRVTIKHLSQNQKVELAVNLNPLKAGSNRQIPPEQTTPSTCLT